MMGGGRGGGGGGGGGGQTDMQSGQVTFHLQIWHTQVSVLHFAVLSMAYTLVHLHKHCMYVLVTYTPHTHHALT